MSPRWEDPQGVPLSAIVFGGRRARVAPLVFQSRDWAHGVLRGRDHGLGDHRGGHGQVGVVRRDPMAMLPFCGYNMGDYFGHWLRTGRSLNHPPAVFHVNWFRTGPDGRFVWPGFGQNLRVLLWMIDRVKGRAPPRRPRSASSPPGRPQLGRPRPVGDPARSAPARGPRRVGSRSPGNPGLLRPLRHSLPEEMSKSLATLNGQLTTAAV